MKLKRVLRKARGRVVEHAADSKECNVLMHGMFGKDPGSNLNLAPFIMLWVPA
jgi:hypothetical protein